MRECSPHTMCNVSCVTCHVSCVMCHVSHVAISPVRCHKSHFLFNFFLLKKWIKCWNLSMEGMLSTGLPRLVFMFEQWFLLNNFRNFFLLFKFWKQTMLLIFRKGQQDLIPKSKPQELVEGPPSEPYLLVFMSEKSPLFSRDSWHVLDCSRLTLDLSTNN